MTRRGADRSSAEECRSLHSESDRPAQPPDAPASPPQMLGLSPADITAGSDQESRV